MNKAVDKEINLRDEIRRFENLTSNELWSKRDEYERQYLQEVPVKNNCQIM